MQEGGSYYDIEILASTKYSLCNPRNVFLIHCYLKYVSETIYYIFQKQTCLIQDIVTHLCIDSLSIKLISCAKGSI